jgi:hypothetical protein
LSVRSATVPAVVVVAASGVVAHSEHLGGMVTMVSRCGAPMDPVQVFKPSLHSRLLNHVYKSANDRNKAALLLVGEQQTNNDASRNSKRSAFYCLDLCQQTNMLLLSLREYGHDDVGAKPTFLGRSSFLVGEDDADPFTRTIFLED